MALIRGILIFAFVFASGAELFAEQGMWMPQQIPAARGPAPRLSASKGIPMPLPISPASPWEPSCRWAAAPPLLCRPMA